MVTKLFNNYCSGLKTEDTIASLHICQWQTHKKVLLLYLFWRWICAIVFLAIFVCSVIDVGRSGPMYELHYEKWWIYLTNWNLLSCLIQAWLAALICTKQMMNNNRDFEVVLQTKVGYIQTIYWICYTIATVYSFIVTICYWSVVYDAATDNLDIVNLMVHVGNSVLMFADIMLVGHPIKMEHAYFTAGLGLSYSIFSLAYFLAGGLNRKNTTEIYPLLDWNKPGKTIVVCVAGVFFVLVVHVICCGMSKLRSTIHTKLFVQKSVHGHHELCKNHALIDHENASNFTAIDLK